MEAYRYKAFISYRHVHPDMDIAKKLHGLIEHFHIPASIQKSAGIKKMGRVFRDQEELPLSVNLGADIDTALQNSEWLIVVGLYLLGIVTGIGVAYISKLTIFKGEAVPFVMELPNYRMPGIKNVAMLLWEKAKDFVERAFTVILVATVIIWFLQTFSTDKSCTK